MKIYDKRIKDLERRAALRDTKPFLIQHWKNGYIDGVAMTLAEVNKYSKNRFIIIHLF